MLSGKGERRASREAQNKGKSGNNSLTLWGVRDLILEVSKDLRALRNVCTLDLKSQLN